MSVPAAWAFTSRETGRGADRPQKGYLRARLLLAPSPALSLRDNSQKSCRVLDGKIHGEPQARSQEPAGSERARMELFRGMAVSAETAKNRRKENS